MLDTSATATNDTLILTFFIDINYLMFLLVIFFTVRKEEIARKYVNYLHEHGNIDDKHGICPGYPG